MKSSEFEKVAILTVDCGWKVRSRVKQYTSRHHLHSRIRIWKFNNKFAVDVCYKIVIVISQNFIHFVNTLAGITCIYTQNRIISQYYTENGSTTQTQHMNPAHMLYNSFSDGWLMSLTVLLQTNSLTDLLNLSIRK